MASAPSDTGQAGGYYRSRLRRAAGLLRHLPLALSLAWDAAPGWTAVWALLLVAQGLLPALLVYLTRAVVNALVALTAAEITPTRAGPVLGLVLVVGSLMLLSEALRIAAGYVRAVQAERILDHISRLTQARSLAVDLAFYDVPEFYDHLHRARSEAGQRPLALLESVGSLLQNSVTLAAMMWVLLPYGAWLPVALLVSTLPALAVVVRGTRRYHGWWLRTTALQRRAWYLDWLMSSRETAAELRLFGLGPHLQRQFRQLREQLRTERLELAGHDSRAEMGAAAFALLITAASLGIVLWQTLTRALLSLGDLALMYQAFTQGQQLTRSLLGHVGQIYRNSLFLGDLSAFLALAPSITDPAEPEPIPGGGGPRGEAPELAFRGLCFAYPGGRGPVLKDFNLTVPAGRTVAIVGRNGAGKSTLIKLLCRFYDPDAGAVLLGGVDLRKLELEALRRSITVLFQTPVQYSATARENIGLADLDAPPPAIPAAAEGAGADSVVARLPDGYETQLGVWFPGGTELSVGEWQRLALARAYLRQAPVMVLDEPTSAMDPWAEAAWFQRFRALARGRTVLLITHRFTTARFADEIHVMDGGQVVESGTHEALLAQGGLYASSWREQTTGFGEAGSGTG